MPNENPYSASIQPQSQHSAKSPMPVGLIVNSILCLLMGLAGLLSAGGSAFAFMAADQLAAMMPAESRESYLAAIESQRILTFINLFLGLAASLLMICGSGGTLLKKPWARKLFNWGLIGFVAWGALMVASSIYMLLFNAAQMIQVNSAQFGENTAKQMFYIGQIVGLVMIAAFIAYYVFVYFYLKRENVDAFFAQQQSKPS